MPVDWAVFAIDIKWFSVYVGVNGYLCPDHSGAPASLMSDIEQQSLRYFVQRGCDPQWQDFLYAMSEELSEQLSLPELRGFFYAEGAAAGAIIEGLYSTWLTQVGVDDKLALRQIGEAEGPADVLKFRLAHQSLFA